MRLNADIIYQNLEKYLDGLAYEGVLDDELTLFRPEFYIEKNTIFQKDHVYVCSADHLPKTPVIEEHVLLISLGRLVPSDIYLADHAYQNRRIAFVENGSWMPMAAKAMRAKLEACKNLEFAETVVSINGALDDAARSQMDALVAELV